MFESSMCIVELFGHSQIAGKVTDVSLGGTAFIRVDVPELDGMPGFTKFYGTGAVYAITPVDEQTMLAAIRAYKVEPVKAWELKHYLPAPQPDIDSDPLSDAMVEDGDYGYPDDDEEETED